MNNIAVTVGMDLIAFATLSIPHRHEDEPQRLRHYVIDRVDAMRDLIIKKAVADPYTATSLHIRKAVLPDGSTLMGHVPIEPLYADAGSMLESAIKNVSATDFYRALSFLLMDEEEILRSFPPLANLLLASLGSTNGI